MKILLVTAGSRGDFEPFYAFAQRATELGHEVFLSVTEEFQPRLTNVDFNVLKLPGSIQYLLSCSIKNFYNKRSNIWQEVKCIFNN